MPAVAKLCVVCGEDVAGKKRMKDPQGHYYCEPCYSAKLAKNKAKSFQTALGAAVPLDDAGGVALATEAAPPPADDGLLDLLPDKKPEAEEEMFGCSGCKKIVPKRQIRNVDGEFLCTSCNAARNRPQQRGGAASPKTAGKKEDAFADENPETWKDTFVGGATISAIIFLVACGAFIGLNYAMPARGAGDYKLVLAFVYGGISVAFLIFRVVCLMCSMIVASKIMGGITFGTIGSALYKTFAFFTVYGIADFFLDRSESFAMLGIGMRFGAFICAFIALYGLDSFEAFLLSAINMGMSWVLTIVMGIALIAAMAAITGHHAMGGDEDAPGFQKLQQQQQVPAPGGAAPGNNAGGAAQPDNDIDNAPFPLIP